MYEWVHWLVHSKPKRRCPATVEHDSKTLSPNVVSMVDCPFNVSAYATECPIESVQPSFLITLEWDSNVNMDLHVIDPGGKDVFHEAPIGVDAAAQMREI